jgi:hypothetical protein
MTVTCTPKNARTPQGAGGDGQGNGPETYSNSLYSTAIANFNSLERPLIWVPGDNDWTDCWGRYGPARRGC